MEGCNRGGPYRATKIWNEIVIAFRSGMPLKKHRRHMRTYENCFSASEAIDWLHNFLVKSSCFGSSVSRQQTVQLLQKFLKAGLFERVGVHSKDHSKNDFKDNSQLYRFLSNTAFSTRRSPLHNLTRIPLSRLNTNPTAECLQDDNIDFLSDKRTCNKAIPLCTEYLPECYFVSRNMSVREVENVWKTLTTARLQSMLGLSSLDDVLDSKVIDGHIIMHNATRFSKTGVVVLKDKTDDLPHWVVSAMKCLTNWPKASGSGSCLPNYPGFEADVFKVVKDYFTNIGIPLIPYGFYHLFQCSFRIRQKNEERSPDKKDMFTKDCGKSRECSGLVSFPSFENLIAKLPLQPAQTNSVSDHKTSTPLYQTEESNSSQVEPTISKGQSSPISSVNFQNYSHGESSKELCYETAFIDISPVTRLVVNHSKEAVHCGSLSSLQTLTSQATSGVETASTISACSHFFPHVNIQNYQPERAEEAMLITNAASNLFRFPSYRNTRNKSGLFGTPRCASVDDLKPSVYGLLPKNRYSYVSAITTLPRKLTAQTIENFSCEHEGNNSLRKSSTHEHKSQNITMEQQNMANHSQSPVLRTFNSKSAIKKSELLELRHSCVDKPFANICSPQQSVSSSSWKTCSNDDGQFSSNVDENNSLARASYHLKDNMDSQLHKSSSLHEESQENICKTGEHFWRKPTFHIACFVDKELECKISEAFQLSLLLIPTPNRRHLHLLLRTLNKMISNNKLNLHPYRPTKDFLLETFARSIICAENEVDYDESEGLKIVSFFLDRCEILFQVPSSLKDEVQQQLACMQRGKIKYTVDDSCMLAYCEQVSLQQYEEQKNALSRQSLSSLLESIANNSKISDKEKKRKLKQFKENYPEIYLARFPTPASEAFIFAKKPKTTLLSRFLSVRL